MSEIKKIIQKNIAEYRKQSNLTQKDLAARLGVKTTSLASWEQGKSMPDIDTLFRLCSLLNIDVLTISGFEPPEMHHKYGNGTESALSDVVNAINAVSTHSVMVGKELAPADPVLAPDERQLVTDYRAFNAEGKEKVRDYVADLADNPKYKKCANSSLDQEA